MKRARRAWARELGVVVGVWALLVGGSVCRSQTGTETQIQSQKQNQEQNQSQSQGQTQKLIQGLAFWEPKPETVKALMRSGGEKDPARYEALRKAFVEAGCTGERVREETVGGHKEKNLFCVLPGGDAGTILVVARYDQRAFEEGGGQWGDAVALPLLYRALEATPRRHSFEFAEIGGKDGEKEFLDGQADATAEVPAVEVVMGGMGLGYPVCSAIKPNSLKRRRRRPPRICAVWRMGWRWRCGWWIRLRRTTTIVFRSGGCTRAALSVRGCLRIAR